MTLKRNSYGKFAKGNKGFWMGKKLSKDHKQKLSKSHKGQVPWIKGKKHPSRGEKHHNWKGDKVGYGALHTWIIRQRGKPNYCEHCKKTDKKKYEWCNIDHKYRRIVNDYIRLCTSCHRKYDYKNNNYATK